MADDFELRAYCYIDRMQPQYASFVGTVTQGDLPVEGMAALYVEMAPGNHVFRVVDVAVKAGSQQITLQDGTPLSLGGDVITLSTLFQLDGELQGVSAWRLCMTDGMSLLRLSSWET